MTTPKGTGDRPARPPVTRSHPSSPSQPPPQSRLTSASAGPAAPLRRRPGRAFYAYAVHLGLVTVVVDEYDPAIGFFVSALGFELVADYPSTTGDGRPQRWVVVRPPGGATGLLLARANGQDQAAAVGKQVAGRVGFFLQVEDFEAAYQRMLSAGVQFVTPPRSEPYGRVAVF